MSSSVPASVPLLVRGSSYLLGAVTSVLIARMLGSYERGVWAVALLVSGLVALFSELGLAAAVVTLSRQDCHRRHAVMTAGCVLATLSGLLASGAALLAVRYGALPLVGGVPADVLATALASVVFVNLLGIGRQVLLEDGDLVGGASSQLVQASILLVSLAALSMAGISTRTAIGAYVVSILAGLAFTVQRLAGRHRLVLAWEGTLIAPLLRTGFVAHLSTLALFLTFRFDLLLVNRLLGPRAAGLYSVSLSLSEMLRGLPELGQMIVWSRSSSADLLAVVKETTRLVVLGTLIAGVLAAVVAYWAIPVLFGAEFAGAVLPFVALVPGVIGLAVSYGVSPVLLLRGQMGVSAGAAVVSLLAMVALDLFVIPRFGLLGAALVSSLAYWVGATVQVWWIRKLAPLAPGQLLPRRSDPARLLSALLRVLRRDAPV
jgi:O-antigen/teichoic acid export membrane protein